MATWNTSDVVAGILPCSVRCLGLGDHFLGGWLPGPFNVDGIDEMAFQAKYRSLCVPCGEDIQPGEYITNHAEHGYIHEECTDVESPQHHGEPSPPSSRTIVTMPRGKTARDRCEQCFMVHATNQRECE